MRLRAYSGLGVLAVLYLVAARPASATLVYSNDFSSIAGPEWSNQSLATSNGEQFLGASANGFGNGTDTLTLTGLSGHTSVTVGFDLYIIQSWDGNGPNGGNSVNNPDGFRLNENGNTLLLSNFANFTGGNTQAFQSQAVTSGTFAPRTGQFAAGHLGFGSGDFGDATYRFSYTFNDSASNLAFAFTSLQNQSPGDEGWGLDNVSVSITGNAGGVATPEPSATVLILSGAGGLLLARHRRRRTAI